MHTRHEQLPLPQLRFMYTICQVDQMVLGIIKAINAFHFLLGTCYVCTR